MTALIRKELAEHGMVFFVFLVLLAVAAAGTILDADQSGSPPWVQLALSGKVTLFVLALVVASRVLTREYLSETQIFIEALPVRRVDIITVKLGFGVIVQVLAAFTIFGTPLLLDIPAPPGDRLGMIFARAALYAVTMFALASPIALLGRFRWAVGLGLFVLIVTVAQKFDTTIYDFGTLTLLSQDFSAQSQIPTDAVVWSVGFSVVGFGAAFGLALLREGDIPARLAQRMSLKERVAVPVVIFSIYLVSYIDDQRREKTPFRLRTKHVIDTPVVHVEVGEGGRPAEEKAWLEIAQETSTRIHDALGLGRPIRTFITLRSTLDPGRFERGRLSETQGIVVRAHPEPTAKQRLRFGRWLSREVAAEHTRRRAYLEDRLWLLDGLGLFLFPPEDPDAYLRAAAEAVHRGPLDVQRWHQVRLAIGRDAAQIVAWALLELQARDKGRDAVRSLLAARFGSRPTRDIRPVLYEPSTAQLVRDYLGLPGLDALVPPLEARVVNAPTESLNIGAEAEFRKLSSRTRQLKARLISNVSGSTLSAALADDVPVELWWIQVPVSPTWPREEDVEVHATTLAQARDGVYAPDTLPVGARIAWTFAVEPRSAPGRVITGWRFEAVE